jgi:murein L,D-transpeptidase YafK
VKSMKFVLRFVLLAPCLLGLAGCFNFLGLGSDSVPPAERQLPASTQALLAIKGMKQESPIFVRIFKEESELEVWKVKDGRFQLFRTYPICSWSGGLGPKVQQGDRQAPEGFYTVSRGQLNPHSLYHLAFNIGFPNGYDQANGHTGSALMVHGDCKSAGCYAMTDAYIEEIYILAREAFNAGQTKFHVQALPFRMTAANMKRHSDSPWYPFWVSLKEGYDSFEMTGKPPIVKVCSKQYLVNVQFSGHATDPAPDGPCPVYAKLDPAQMPAIDGVPQIALASLSKPDVAAPVAMAAPVQQSPSTAQPVPVAEMSASAVITRQPATPASTIASMQPAKLPAKPVYTAPRAPVEPDSHPSPVIASAGSSAQPVSYQVGPRVQAPAPVPAIAPAAGDSPQAADPNALQKVDRSGKGGRLGAGDAVSVSGAGTAEPVSLGMNGPR